MIIFSCVKEESVNIPVIDPTETKQTWATVVNEYPFLDGFPVFDGKSMLGIMKNSAAWRH